MENLQLTIFISRTSVHITEVFCSNQEVLLSASFDLIENTPEGYKQRLNEIFNQLDLKEEYHEYSLAWGTPQNTLVPLSVFNQSSSKAIFKLMFGAQVDEQTIDFNRLMELNMVNVYEIPDWVKSFFVLKFPKILIQQEHTMTLRALFQKNTFDRRVFLSLCNNYINIDVIYHNELSFSNNFEFQTVEDILYHLLFVLEQEKLTEEKGELNFLFTDEETQLKAEEIQKQIKKLNVLKKMKIGPIDSILKLQTLCV